MPFEIGKCIYRLKHYLAQKEMIYQQLQTEDNQTDQVKEREELENEFNQSMSFDFVQDVNNDEAQQKAE